MPLPNIDIQGLGGQQQLWNEARSSPMQAPWDPVLRAQAQESARPAAKLSLLLLRLHP